MELIFNGRVRATGGLFEFHRNNEFSAVVFLLDLVYFSHLQPLECYSLQLTKIDVGEDKDGPVVDFLNLLFSLSPCNIMELIFNGRVRATGGLFEFHRNNEFSAVVFLLDLVYFSHLQTLECYSLQLTKIDVGEDKDGPVVDFLNLLFSLSPCNIME
ncbi:uncharacterized protein LOC112904237 [Agrilus planipennis]|uniref:Uncharacterized protein LOC112904237 n=1 Tax=Agrilus planipennis TaxID=224129 RepID=A0A7F5R2H7_AGRPL|nr:uncharacterized protein LOC112904237 [Agrilus planipennis]